jgi:hypothetical protein
LVTPWEGELKQFPVFGICFLLKFSQTGPEMPVLFALRLWRSTLAITSSRCSSSADGLDKVHLRQLHCSSASSDPLTAYRSRGMLVAVDAITAPAYQE